MSKWHGGKGSKQRDGDYDKFSAGYDAIFNRKKDEHGSSPNQPDTSGLKQETSGADEDGTKVSVE
tara:strand:- start:409 stop:603 length:195 start_codon:yes stop_codon:yes gene_type:complete